MRSHFVTVCPRLHVCYQVLGPNCSCDVTATVTDQMLPPPPPPRGVFLFEKMCFYARHAVWVATGASTLTEKYLAMILPVSAFVAFGAEHSVSPTQSAP